ncbi:MAG: transcriptional regulator [Citromicrobium sp.]|nr:MAG: transcriptional regulator [Citromicrobium sp.]
MNRKTMSNNATGFGISIRRARLGYGWTQEQLAENAEVSRPSIARIEAGQDVSTATLTKVIDALHMVLRIESA